MTEKSSIREDAFVAQARSILARAEADRSILHAGLRGSAVEHLISDFVGQYLPRRFAVTSGLVIGSDDSVSAQTDLIIYDQEQASPIPSTTTVIPAEAVVGIVEIKTGIRIADLRKTVNDTARFKGLPQLASDLHKLDPESGGTKRQSLVMPWLKQSTMLGLSSQLSLDKIAAYWHQHYTDVRFGYQLDSILCMDRGLIMLAASHPENRNPGNAMNMVPCVSPGIDDPQGPRRLSPS